MIITIVLKKQDAIGLGGDLLVESGMEPGPESDQIFTMTISPMGDDGVGLVQQLLDHGIKPIRVRRKIVPNTMVSGSFDPLEGAPKSKKLALV